MFSVVDPALVAHSQNQKVHRIKMAAPQAAQPAINIDAVGQAFVKHYYSVFDTAINNLAGLYVRLQPRIHSVSDA